MNSMALRSDCSSRRPILVLVVTKNVRRGLSTASGVAWRKGFMRNQGLKPESSTALCGPAKAVPCYKAKQKSAFQR